MNINRLFNMLGRILTGWLVSWGIRRKNAPKPGERQSASQRQREKTMRQSIKRARQAARITRRMGR